MAEQNLVRRKCDWCGDVQEFDDKPITPKDALRVQGWAILVRVFLVNDQRYPVQKHACKDSCATNIITTGMLDLPQEIKDSIAEQEKQRILAIAAAAETTKAAEA